MDSDPRERHKTGSVRGGQARVPKGLAKLTPEQRSAIRAKALASRRRKTVQKEQETKGRNSRARKKTA